MLEKITRVPFLFNLNSIKDVSKQLNTDYKESSSSDESTLFDTLLLEDDLQTDSISSNLTTKDFRLTIIIISITLISIGILANLIFNLFNSNIHLLIVCLNSSKLESIL